MSRREQPQAATYSKRLKDSIKSILDNYGEILKASKASLMVRVCQYYYIIHLQHVQLGHVKSIISTWLGSLMLIITNDIMSQVSDETQKVTAAQVSHVENEIEVRACELQLDIPCN